MPLQISSGGRGFGAAGVGWDIPLSFVRVDDTYAHRRPQKQPNLPIAPRSQITVALPGQYAEMVQQSTNLWIGRNTPTLSMRKENDVWKVFDGSGLTYVFSQQPCGGISCPGLVDLGMWLLRSIEGPGNSVVLTYDVKLVTLPGASTAATSIDLIALSYNVHSSGACSKNEIALSYDLSLPTDPPKALSVMGTRAIVRQHKLTSVNVMGRASCGASPERLRLYTLNYLVDPDTRQDRLASVQMYGREGTDEANVAVPVAEFTYGTATTVAPSGNHVLQYVNPQS
ncbi:MAG: hypothetical protein HOV81_05665, partial [Kofleriaceae bacterium]|nr:hypothetical protein [Kofleriaceae bacterium]